MSQSWSPHSAHNAPTNPAYLWWHIGFIYVNIPSVFASALVFVCVLACVLYAFMVMNGVPLSLLFTGGICPADD